MKLALLLLAACAMPALGQVSVTAVIPPYGYSVLPGSQRQIIASIANGTLNTVNWSVLSSTGGATASFQDPTHTSATTLSATLPTARVVIGSTAGNCTVSGSIGSYVIASTATVTVQVQSVDDTTKTAQFVFNVCAESTTPLAVPDYQQAFKGQVLGVQSFVFGAVDETGTWSILSQPSGGDGALQTVANASALCAGDTAAHCRDAEFAATVTGRYTLKFTSAHDTTKSAQVMVYVSPNSLPAYASTPNKTEPRECYADPGLTGSVYDVGAGFPYATLQSTPAANTLAAGSILRVHNTDTTGTSPSTFHENYQIAKAGSFGQPMGLCGIPDSLGNLPVVDGSSATMQTGLSSGGCFTYGILCTWAGGYGNNPTGLGFQAGYGGPSHFFITGLRLTHATPNYSATLNGTTTAYSSGADCINIRSGSYGLIAGNDLDTCANAIGTYENTSNGFSTVSALLYIRGNHLQHSGYSTDSTEHNAYLQSFYTVFEGNLLDNYTSTAQGSNVKWRGVELVARYNFLSGNAAGSYSPSREFDLVEVQDASAFVTNEQYFGPAGGTNCNYSTYCLGDTGGPNMIAAFQESLMKDFVYGNEILGASSQNQIHYNGDHDGGMSDRMGQLYFFSNTLDQANVLFDTALNLSGATRYLAGAVNAQNNILWSTGSNGVEFGINPTLIFAPTTNLMRLGSFSIGVPPGPAGCTLGTNCIPGGSWNGGTANGWSNQPDYAAAYQNSVPLDPHLYNLSAGNFLTASTQPYSATTFLPTAPVSGTAQTGIIAALPLRREWQTTSNAMVARTNPTTIGASDAGGFVFILTRGVQGRFSVSGSIHVQ